jgi:hypothetical protein
MEPDTMGIVGGGGIRATINMTQPPKEDLQRPARKGCPMPANEGIPSRMFAASSTQHSLAVTASPCNAVPNTCEPEEGIAKAKEFSAPSSAERDEMVKAEAGRTASASTTPTLTEAASVEETHPRRSSGAVSAVRPAL